MLHASALPPVVAFLLASAAALSAGESGIAVAIAVATAAIAVLTLVRRTLPGSARAQSSLSEPRRSIGISVPLAQSDLAAPGHSRPRAPGSAAPAA